MSARSGILFQLSLAPGGNSSLRLAAESRQLKRLFVQLLQFSNRQADSDAPRSPPSARTSLRAKTDVYGQRSFAVPGDRQCSAGVVTEHDCRRFRSLANAEIPLLDILFAEHGVELGTRG